MDGVGDSAWLAWLSILSHISVISANGEGGTDGWVWISVKLVVLAGGTIEGSGLVLGWVEQAFYLKIKLENEVIVKQVFQVEDLLLTCY